MVRSAAASVAAVGVGALLLATPASAAVQPPAIEAAYSANLTPTTAVLHAQVNPGGAATNYRFEYGATTKYGATAPLPEGHIETGLLSPHDVKVELTGLAEHLTYHFRVFATNSAGEVEGEDQTFDFFPEACPNASLRQQTGSSYLPDCRAYELVSPASAGNVIFGTGAAPPGPYAENPPRYAFSGILGAVTGTNPPDSISPDNYVATRTDTGWVTKYAGIHGDEHLGAADTAADLDLDKFIDFTTSAFAGVSQPPSNGPFVWDYNGNSLGRWPADLTQIPDGEDVEGAFQPSPDFTHLAFSSDNVVFPTTKGEGTLTNPGSVYDYDTVTGKTELISYTPSGENIPAQLPGEFIEIPPSRLAFNGSYSAAPPSDPQGSLGVSTDGSHILMSTTEIEPCPPDQGGCAQEPPSPVRLYMRVDDAVTYDVSRKSAHPQ